MENKRFFLYFGLLGFFVMFYNNFYLIKDVMIDGKNCLFGFVWCYVCRK